MKTRISILTSNEKLYKLAGMRKTALCPNEHIKNTLIDLRSILYKPDASEESLADQLIASTKGADRYLLIADKEIKNSEFLLNDSFAKIFLDSQIFERKGENYIKRQVSIGLKRLEFLSRVFGDAKTQKLALLPIRNFSSAELPELINVVSNDLENGESITKIEQILKSLRERVNPKRKSSHKNRYIIDDRNFYFEYGTEKHALPETKSPPHAQSCISRANFRFGCRYDHQRHFNVSLDGDKRFSGEFKNCHGEQHACKNATHLNIFSNDFIT